MGGRRRIPQRKPLTRPIGNRAIILRVLDPQRYIVAPGSRVSQAEIGFYSGHGTLAVGQEVVAEWREEMRAWFIHAAAPVIPGPAVAIITNQAAPARMATFPFNTDSEEWGIEIGEPPPVVDSTVPPPVFRFSPNGRLALIGREPTTTDLTLVRYDPETGFGSVVRTVTPLAGTDINGVAWHPDGTHVACTFEVGIGTPVLGVLSVPSLEVVALYTSGNVDGSAVEWHPSGDFLAFGRNATSGFRLRIIEWTGSAFGSTFDPNMSEVTLAFPRGLDWHRDGTFLFAIYLGSGVDFVFAWAFDVANPNDVTTTARLAPATQVDTTGGNTRDVELSPDTSHVAAVLSGVVHAWAWDDVTHFGATRFDTAENWGVGRLRWIENGHIVAPINDNNVTTINVAAVWPFTPGEGFGSPITQPEAQFIANTSGSALDIGPRFDPPPANPVGAGETNYVPANPDAWPSPPFDVQEALDELIASEKTYEKTLVFYVAGELATGLVPIRMHAPRAMTIENVTATVAIAPTGAALIVDVNKNAVTIFTTQANRPTIPDGQQNDLTSTPDVTDLAVDDLVEIAIDQIGSTTPGEDLVVQVRCTLPTEGWV